MKELLAIWNNLVGRTYNAVNTSSDCQTKSKEVSPQKIRNSALKISAISIFGLLCAGFIYFVDPYKLIFDWKLTFREGGEIYEIWRKPEVDLYLKVYLWNVTNKEEYMSGKDSKLKLQEVGPYVYRELLEHSNVTFNDNGTLTSIPKHPLVWVPEQSGERREDDLVILPNIALLSIADVVSTKSFFTRLGLNVLIRQTNSEPLVEMTAREFMFGYKSTLMTLGNKFLPKWIYFDKLGLIDRMYDFEGDYETFYTGQDKQYNRIGLLEKFNGETKIPQWDSPCGDVSGSSDATKFPSYIKPNDTLLFFRKSLCRAKELVHVNDTILDGHHAYVYTFVSDADDNGWVHEKNKCFCKNRDVCLPPGLLDVRGCYYGFPIALSYPHFLDGDASLSSKIEGVYPNDDQHRSYFILERNAGLPLKLAVRYQINMALGNLHNIANSERFSNMVLPLLWTEIGIDHLPTNYSLLFKLYLIIAPVVVTYLMYSLLIFGIILLIYSIYRFIKARTVEERARSRYSSPWIEDAFVRNIDKKLSSYIPDRRRSFPGRELEVFLDKMSKQHNNEADIRRSMEVMEVC